MDANQFTAAGVTTPHRAIKRSQETFDQVLEFAGYIRYWNNLSADSVLPILNQEQGLQLVQAQADAKQTQPPPRYSESKLVKLHGVKEDWPTQHLRADH